MEEKGEKEIVCVTGGGGYIASWVVKFLLCKGFIVHGTVRDPSDEKNIHLRKFERASENLRLFKSDLLDYQSLYDAIDGCGGVFHIASPVPSDQASNSEEEVIKPAVIGTRNIIKACEEAKVKKLLIVSSIAAVVFNPNWPRDLPMDEECWSQPEFCKTKKYDYFLAKTMAESEALEHAKKSEIKIITVCPSLVLGPMLQPTLNTTSSFFLSFLKDGGESVEDKGRHVVDVRDLGEAIMLLYGKPEAQGRYICSSYALSTQELMEKLKSIYPNYNYPQSYTEVGESLGWKLKLSSEKLKSLGWKYRPLEETLVDYVKNFEEMGFLPKHQSTNYIKNEI